MDILSLLIVQADVFKALEIMWKGVVAIFLVIALVIVVTKVVNNLCVRMETKRAEKEKESAQQSEKNQ